MRPLTRRRDDDARGRRADGRRAFDVHDLSATVGHAPPGGRPGALSARFASRPSPDNVRLSAPPLTAAARTASASGRTDDISPRRLVSSLNERRPEEPGRSVGHSPRTSHGSSSMKYNKHNIQQNKQTKKQKKLNYTFK